MPNVDDELMHYGVKGMRWGVSRAAKKDATEFAKAKMYYGQGAGTRRKLIKAKVEAQSARDPQYKQAFEYHLANQPMDKRARQAKSQRHRTDAVQKSAKTGRGILHVLNGNAMYASAASIAIVGAGKMAHDKGYDKVVLDAGKHSYNTIIREAKALKIKQQFKNFNF